MVNKREHHSVGIIILGKDGKKGGEDKLSLLCPRCHRPFTKEILESEPVRVWEHKPEFLDEGEFCGARTWPSQVDFMKEVVEFKDYCSCKHCRHGWTEIKTVEFEK